MIQARLMARIGTGYSSPRSKEIARYSSLKVIPFKFRARIGFNRISKHCDENLCSFKGESTAAYHRDSSWGCSQRTLLNLSPSHQPVCPTIMRFFSFVFVVWRSFVSKMGSHKIGPLWFHQPATRSNPLFILKTGYLFRRWKGMLMAWVSSRYRLSGSMLF